MIQIDKAKLWKIGTSHVVTVPRQYIVKGILTPNKYYSITINEKEVRE